MKIKSETLIIEITKKGGGYCLVCNNEYKAYGVPPQDISNYYQMFINGIEAAGGKFEISDDSFGVLNEAALIVASD